MIRSKNTEIRAAAVRALSKFDAEIATEALLEILNDEDSAVQMTALDVISDAGDKRFIPFLYQFLKSENPLLKSRAILILRNLNGSEDNLFNELSDMLSSDRFEDVLAALDICTQFDKQKIIEILESIIMKKNNPKIRIKIIKTLKSIREKFLETEEFRRKLH